MEDIGYGQALEQVLTGKFRIHNVGPRLSFNGIKPIYEMSR